MCCCPPSSSSPLPPVRLWKLVGGGGGLEPCLRCLNCCGTAERALHCTLPLVEGLIAP